MERLRKTLERAGIPFQTEYSLAACSSFRIGGPADTAILPASREQMLLALRAVTDAEIPFLVIGNASNVVFSDEGFRGAVILTGGFRDLTVEGSSLHVSAGCSLASVAAKARDYSLTGMEFAHGIPGTVGGAVFMNAGAYGGCMADICVRSEYFDTKSGECRVRVGTEQEFATRSSIYEKNPHYAILGATLSLKSGDRSEISAKMNELASRRKQSQPLEYPSAGSVFKRPEGYFAGKLIEDCGLKGLTVGGAQVSQKHAGFIINVGGATAADVRRLTEIIQERVYAAYGVMLACEIRFY